MAINRLRARFNAFVDRNELLWVLSMAAFAVVYVAVGFAADEVAAAEQWRLDLVDAGLTTLFVAEFSVRFVASYDRRRYLRGHWIDLVALIPLARGVRVLRVLRLLRLVRGFAGVYRAAMTVERLGQHRGFALLLTAWLGVMVICSTALYLAERDINENLQSPFDALWWGVVTLTTIGYGDIYPVTPEGRIAAMTLMLLGVTLFAGITATFTSFLLAPKPVAPSGTASTSPVIEDHVHRIITLRDAGVLTEDEALRAFSRIAGESDART